MLAMGRLLIPNPSRLLPQISYRSLNLPPGVKAPHGAMQLYVGSLHFNLTESDIKQVFEPFGELEFVDLHRDPMTGRSKGYAFVQYKRAEDAKMALEQMEGFDLAGRPVRLSTLYLQHDAYVPPASRQYCT
jgi:RNA-binding protein 39